MYVLFIYVLFICDFYIYIYTIYIIIYIYMSRKKASCNRLGFSETARSRPRRLRSLTRWCPGWCPRSTSRSCFPQTGLCSSSLCRIRGFGVFRGNFLFVRWSKWINFHGLHGMQWYAMYINVYILFMVSFVGSTLEYVHPWSIWEQLLPCFLALREGFP